ncbi:FUSC family protein [Streptomyces fodineus]|uniref:FUSC family protein n=1 Tax=Streptomyces fodineus TaxID=1904616 RepID=UPI000AB4F3F5|nr:FUSC family protein [Streptomyces fodineus]
MSRPAAPPWLAHALRAQRGPVPWSAVVRGALAAGPLLLAGVGTGRTAPGVLAAIGAMLAGINDRPGSRRAAVKRLGVPALAGTLGLLAGTYAGQGLAAVPLTLALTGLGLIAGGISAVGPVASAAGTQLLVGAAIGAGMPAADSGWQRALAFLAGAGWLLVLRLALPTPGSLAGDFRFDGERAAVAAVYDAIAALVEAVGGAQATARRAALTAALDQAQDALAGPRLRRYASSAAERRLHAQYAAALPLAEAATALFWAGEPVSARAAEGPRRLAAAVRGNTGAGPLPAPHRSDPALRALDGALLRAAEAFDGVEGARDRLLTGPRRLAAAVRGNPGAGPLPAPRRSAPGLRALDGALLRAAEAFDGVEGARDRLLTGPRRLAAAVRGNTGTGPLPAPDRSSAVRGNTGAGPLPAPRRSAPALRALDGALLRAAEAFGRVEGARDRLLTRPRGVRDGLRDAFGTGGREYGLRVALCFGASAAIAQALHHTRWYGPHQHWYWLPATAVFLVKPDLGPLASRVLCRAAGTVLGALVFAGLAALLPRPAGLIALVAVCGALVPVATRHFAALTAVVTVLVLALVMAGGEPQASVSRIGETLLACALVLVVGHLPMPGERGGAVRARLAAAGSAAHAYLVHVLALGESGDRAERWALRREAYRTLAEARTAIALAAAELPALARHTAGTDAVAEVLERLVDTTTACAVHLDDTGRLTPRHIGQLHDTLAELELHGVEVPLPAAA